MIRNILQLVERNNMTYLLIFIIFSLLLYIREISKKLRATRHELNKVKDVYHKLRSEGV